MRAITLKVPFVSPKQRFTAREIEGSGRMEEYVGREDIVGGRRRVVGRRILWGGGESQRGKRTFPGDLHPRGFDSHGNRPILPYCISMGLFKPDEIISTLADYYR